MWKWIAGLLGVGAGVVVYKHMHGVSLAVGSMVKLPIGKMLGGAGQPLMTQRDLDDSLKRHPEEASELQNGLNTLWDVEILDGKAPSGLIAGASMSPTERKPFPLFFRASDVAGPSSAQRLTTSRNPAPTPVRVK